MRTQTFDYDLSKISREAQRDFDISEQKRKSPQLGKRVALFFDRRYRLNSYKARKAGISRPSVTMSFCGDKFRLYGAPENNKLFDKAKQILGSWKARNKQDMRAYKLYVKAHKKDYVSFNEWLRLCELVS